MDLKNILSMLEQQGMKLLGGLAVLVAGLFAIHWLMKLLDKNKRLKNTNATLKTFLHNILRIALYATLILTVAGIIGIPLTSFVTVLASAGVAISLAMQGALSNFVGGVILLMLKPFKNGEYIKVGGDEGSVVSIGVFYTDLVTPDCRHISIPNSSLTNTSIINYTREGKRRLDAVFSVGYSSDISLVRSVLLGMANRNPAVFKDPAAEVLVSEHADSAIKCTLRLWCHSADYLALSFYMLENGKRALDEAGIEIPFPQMDVHIKEK